MSNKIHAAIAVSVFKTKDGETVEFPATVNVKAFVSKKDQEFCLALCRLPEGNFKDALNGVLGYLVGPIFLAEIPSANNAQIAELENFLEGIRPMINEIGDNFQNFLDKTKNTA